MSKKPSSLVIVPGERTTPPDDMEELKAYLDFSKHLFGTWLQKYEETPELATQAKAVVQLLRQQELKLVKEMRGIDVVKFADKAFEEDVLPSMGANYVVGKGFEYNGGVSNESEFLDQVSALANSLGKWWPVQKAGIGSTLLHYVNRQYAKLQEEARRFLAPVDKAKGRAAVTELVAFLRDVAAEDVDICDVVAVESMLWQVKRKALGHYKNHWPLMVIFTGGQGYAKTSALGKLFKPLEAVTAGNKRLKTFNNQFNAIDFSRYLVLPFNDMANNVQYDLEEFKSMVSDDTFQYRDPHSKKSYKLSNTATLYGTSNQPVAQSIPDDTGARRWWEIDSPNRTASDADIARMLAVPYADCWLAVDGNEERNPRHEYLERMAPRQTVEMRHIPPLEDAVGALIDRDETLTVRESAQFSEVYAAIAGWFRDQDCRAPMKSTVLQLLKKRGFQANQDRSRPVLQFIRLIPRGDW